MDDFVFAELKEEDMPMVWGFLYYIEGLNK